MADKNLARSGAADIDLLSDDDPLAELARIVGYEPRNVPTAARPVPPEPLQETAFDLESELLREFARYDAPPLDPIADVDRDAATELSGDGVLSEADLSDAAVARSDLHIDGATGLPIPDQPEPLPFAGSLPDGGPDRDAAENPALATPEPMPELSASDVAWWPVATPVPATPVPAASMPGVTHDAPSTSEPVFLGLQPAALTEATAEPAPLDLDRELELSLGDAFAETTDVSHVEAQTHHADTPRLSDAAPSYDAAASGLVAASSDATVGAVSGSIIDTLFTTDLPDRVQAELPPPAYPESMPVGSEGGEGAHFEVAELPVEVGSVDFVPAWMSEQRVDAPLAVAEDALASSVAETAAETIEIFEPKPLYEVAPAARVADGYELDELLAEVERFPVPESPAPVATPLETPRPRPGTLDGFSSVKYGRATPVALDRQPASAAAQPMPAAPTPVPLGQVVAPAEPPAALAVEPLPETSTPRHAAQQPAEPVNDYDAAVAAAAVEDAFANFEIDFSDVEFDLDPSDLVLGDEAKPAVAQLPPQSAPGPASVSQIGTVDVAVPAQPVSPQAEPARFEPVLPVEAAAPAVPEPIDIDGALPFDPSLIADTDTGVAPVAELDVPQLPAIEKEKPPVHPPEFDFDIDAEMAQLFAAPAAGGEIGGVERLGTVTPAVTAAKAGPVEADEFDKALEEDLRRSLSQPERHAIPLDAQQVEGEYVGDGYDEPVRRGKGMLIAAAAAVVVLGGAGVYAFMAGSGVVGTSSGEPRVILADKEPVKIVPEEKGGKTVPNQDKAVYDRVAGASEARPQQEQLVTSTEEPVDVVQRTLAPESLPFDGPEDEMPADDATTADDRLLPGVDDTAGEPGQNEDRSPIVSPRKVRTMIVKPDGTLVAREEPVAEPQSALASPDNAVASAANNANEVSSSAAGATAVPSATAEAGLRAEHAGEVATAVDENARALQDAADAAVADSAPVRVVRTTTAGAPADAPALAGGDQTAGTVADGAPVPVMRPADQPVNVVGTVTERGRVADATPTETAALASDAAQQPVVEQAPAGAANPGGYVIQIASLPSEEEAQRSYNSLSAKFSGVIGGRGVDIKRADIPNKGTYFRVRIPAGSREEANALCAKYKGAGGSCLVTR